MPQALALSVEEAELYREAFEAVDLIRAPGGCLIWTGPTYQSGRPKVRRRASSRVKRDLSATKVAYVLANGPLPAGVNVLHSCDVGTCVRAHHLRAGTQSENIREAIAKGRMRTPRMPGALNPQVILTETEVLRIRAAGRDQATREALAAELNVSPRTIKAAQLAETWQHV